MDKPRRNTHLFPVFPARMACYLLAFLMFSGVFLLQAAEENQPPAQDSVNDSTEADYSRYRSKTTWETLLSLPGTLLYLPFDIVGEGLTQLVIFTDEGNTLQKISDFLVSDDGKRGLYPTSAPPIGVGLKFFQKGLFGEESKLSLSASRGLRTRQKYQFKVSRIQLGGPIAADVLAKYHIQPDEYFFGVESAAPNGTDVDDNRTNYLLEQTYGEFRLGGDWGEKLTIKGVAGYEINSVRGGKNTRYTSLSELASESTLPGFENDLGLVRLQLEARSDHRNSGVRPTSGGVALLRGGIFQETGTHDSAFDFGFWKLTADISQHIHLFHKRTLILRVAGELTEPLDADKTIPFYYLSELGREESVRGFLRGRFRDENMVLGSAEYRFPIWEKLDTFMFYDTGKVFADSEFSDAKWKSGYGLGFTFWGKTDVVTNAALGFSEDGLRFYFGLNREL